MPDRFNPLAAAWPIPPEWADSVHYPPSVSPEEAKAAIWNATGVPDLQSAGNALMRGEPLQALGQGVVGAASLLGLAAPAVRIGGLALREGLPAVPGVLADTTGAIRGWHGTPHTFQAEEGAPLGRFRDEAIGSGEGAQAYGYGHYVAGNKGVGESYQSTLSHGGTIDINGNSYPAISTRKIVEKEFPDFASDNHIAYPLQLALDNMLRGVNFEDAFISMHDEYPQFPAEKIAQAEVLLRRAVPVVNRGGNLLEVHILPEESELLDWDKPLSSKLFQNEKFSELLGPDSKPSDIAREASKYDALSDFDPNKKSWQHITGEDVYHALSKRLGGDREASAALHEAGIPGIRYLDAGSRVAGEGTHNYVIFHPSNLRIIGRNGERLEPVEGDPFEESR